MRRLTLVFPLLSLFLFGCFPDREETPPTPVDPPPPASGTTDAGPEAPLPQDAGPDWVNEDAGNPPENEPDAGAPPEPASDGGTVVPPGIDAGVEDPCDLSNLEPEFEFPFEWPVATESVSITEHSSWKNQITPDDPFVVATDWGVENPMRWVKFSVLVADPSKVYFQDSEAFPFHYDFASVHLDPFVGMTTTEFDAVSLYEEEQEVILGAVIFPPESQEGLDPNEYGVQLVRQDAYHPEMVKMVFDLVKASIDADPTTTALYFPTFENNSFESASVQCAMERYFTEQNVPLGSVQRWLTGNTCYSEGWALGTLRYVTADEIESSYEAGELKPTDILVTDAVPAELPYVAGILTLAPTTPNSHVAILSQVYQIPFVHVHFPSTVDDLMSRLGDEVLVSATENWWTMVENPCAVRFYDIAGAYAPDTEAALYALKDPAPVAYTPMGQAGTNYIDIQDHQGAAVRPEHVDLIGGKAANFGMLRESIPDNSPPAVAFTFDLWQAFLDQNLDSGLSLRATIDATLSDYTYPPDFALLHEDLDAVRDLIKDASFTEAQKTDIQAAIAGYDSNRKIRFRSSTNVEDTTNFTGAGLYSSYSGCKADDEDEDSEGPSICDPSKNKERGVYRAMKKVYASFYNDNAFLERLRRGVVESEVGMGILAHYSFPDETELANGVITLRKQNSSYTLDVVSQPGAVSVTNPETAARPEVVEISIYNFSGGSSTYVDISQYADLLPLGGTVLDTHEDDSLDEYHQLAALMIEVTDAFESTTNTDSNYILDLEFKKITDWGLVVKQLRQLPYESNDGENSTFLLDEGVSLCLFQGEYSDVYANHRGKLVWDITTANIQLLNENLEETFVTGSSLALVSDAETVALNGLPHTWSNGEYSFDERASSALHAWQVDHGSYTTDYELTVTLPQTVPTNQSPIVTLNDLVYYLKMEHSTPLPTLSWNGFETTKEETVRLEPCRGDELPPNSNYRERTFDGYGYTDFSIVSRFYHPPFPQGPTAGYTEPMQKWLDTTITGFTDEPLVLSSIYAQSYRPGHHNFGEYYLFEPRLDPNVTQAQLDELAELDLVRIYWEWGSIFSIPNIDYCANATDSDCCGNGVIEENEECDAGDENGIGACDYDCEIATVYCDEANGVTSNCCGDGIIQSNEQCDDGNDDGRDGCNYACEITGGVAYETFGGELITVH